METALYVFCFARAEACHAALGPGLDEGMALRTLTHGDIAALCCEVPRDDWVGARGEANLKDLAWLGPRAIRHEQVIEQVMETSPVLPLRFGCLFSSEDRVRATLARAGGRVAAFLEEANEREEWSLKGFFDASTCGARTGVKAAEEEALAALADLVLARRARRTARIPEGSSKEVAFHWALLLPRGAARSLEERLQSVAARLSTQGLTLEARGPWPPFGFAPSLDEEPAEH